MILVRQFLVEGFDSNFSYPLYDDVSLEAAIVDPSGDMAAVYEYCKQCSLTIRGVILTHAHSDHFDALTECLECYPVLIYVHASGVSAVSHRNVKPLEADMELQLGECDVSVLYTPGHSIDSICLYIDYEAAQARAPQLISGDTFSVEGCGRTSEEHVKVLYDSLQMLKLLPPKTVAYPGHDYGPAPTSTIARESAHNRYLTTDDF